MAKKTAGSLEAVGWLFWLITFLVLVGPLVYGCWQITHAAASRLVPVVTGAALAAVGSGLIAWPVNSFLQYRNKKRRLAQRKKARKRQK